VGQVSVECQGDLARISDDAGAPPVGQRLNTPTSIVIVSARSRPDPGHAGDVVESRIEAEDSTDAALLHDGNVHGIPRRQAWLSEQDGLGSIHYGQLDWEHLVHDAKERIEGGLDGVQTADGRITMENLLENLRVGHQPLAPRD
jgi:hypothetical protein